jgi:hypothetical protein
LARLAAAAVRYADCRIADDTAAGVGSGRTSRIKPGEFVADELSLLLRDQPYQMRCLLARSRRLACSLPTVWDAFTGGEVDFDQVRVIDGSPGGSPRPPPWPRSMSKPWTQRKPGPPNNSRSGCFGWWCSWNR